MLNVGKIEEGFVLDHIEAGKSLEIYHHLKLDKLDCTVAGGRLPRRGIARLFFTVFTAIDFLFFIRENKDVRQLLLNGGDAPRISAFQYVVDFTGEHKLLPSI